MKSKNDLIYLRLHCVMHWENPFGKPQSAGEKLTRHVLSDTVNRPVALRWMHCRVRTVIWHS